MANKANAEQKVGILAFGSLICDPGCEIKKNRIRTIPNISTGFPVEFARTSESRGGAPTLVRVNNGGKPVTGQVFEMGLSEHETKIALYKREMRIPKEAQIDDDDLKEKIDTMGEYTPEGFDVVFYANFSSNIQFKEPQDQPWKELARYAIDSVKNADPFLDGISYLIAAKDCGIVTEWSEKYEKAILCETDCDCLLQALAQELAKVCPAQE